MPIELERSRKQLADAALRIASSGVGTVVTTPMLEASEALEEIIGYPGAFEPVDLSCGLTMSFERSTENSVTPVLSGAGIELVCEEVERPAGGMGAFGDARFRADQVRRWRSLVDELQAAGMTAEVEAVREAAWEAEAEATLRTHVLANQDAFQGPSLVAGLVRDWLEGDQREIAPLAEALATPAPSRTSRVSEN